MADSILSNDNEDDEVWDETAEGQTIMEELALKKCGKLLFSQKLKPSNNDRVNFRGSHY